MAFKKARRTVHAVKKADRIETLVVKGDRLRYDGNSTARNGLFSSQNVWVVSTPGTTYTHDVSVIGNLTGNIKDQGEPAFQLVRAAMKEGLPRAAFDRVKNAMAMTTEELSSVTGIPARTMARRKKFTPNESERLFRVAATFQKAVEMTGDLGKARKWFSTPKTALSSLTPIECCDTEAGSKEVENLIGRIEEGVYS